jgi:ubiquinone biosynthesis protein
MLTTPAAPASTARAGKPLPRLVGILRVLSRHGVLGALRGRRGWPPPEHVRLALEELGVVFLKFGQVLALRRDLLPAAYAQELERLHDRLPPLVPGEARRVVEAELGRPLERAFAAFQEEPLAAATVAQVHVATLLDGRAVVVKVRRPELEPRIAEDVAALAYLARAAERAVPRLRTLDPTGMVHAFHAGLLREIDFRNEARNIRRFRAAMADVAGLWIPDVVEELSGAAVLVLEHSPGERLEPYVERHPERARALAAAVASLVTRQVFERGLFHADPHPGNVFVLPDGRICLHDFGMIGELDERSREALVGVLEATVEGDAAAVADAYLELGLVGEDLDRPALEADLAALLADVRRKPIAEVSIGEAIESLLRVGARHRVRNPGELLLLARAFLISEAVVRRLDPELNVIEVFRAQLGPIAARRWAPDRLLSDSRRLAVEVDRLVRQAPELGRGLRRLARGELGRLRAPALEDLVRRLDRGVERLAGAVASAALLVAGALLAAVGGWHRVAGDVLLAAGLAGVVAVAVGALRQGRR